MKKDAFSISMTLRHPSLDPSDISNAFSLEPRFSWKAESRAGEIEHKYTVWHGLLAEGAGSDKYEEALKRAVVFLESCQEWLAYFSRSEGELDVIFGFSTELDEGLICQASFYPELIARLSKLNAGIRVDIWKDENGRESPIE